MKKSANIREKWAEVVFDFPYTGNIKLEVSNLGKVRRSTDCTNYREVKGSLFEGYRKLKYKFLMERDAATQKRLDAMKTQIMLLIRVSGKMRTRNKIKRIKDASYSAVEEKIKEQTILLEGLKKKYEKLYKASQLKRTINKAWLIHRLVAEYFLTKPSDEHIIVAHLDHDKLNNHVSNLKWMTQSEFYRHQRTNPEFIDARKNASERLNNAKLTNAKLTAPKIMLIKKKINEGIKLRVLAKSFKVSETQLLRIKRGINWGHVEAAK